MSARNLEATLGEVRDLTQRYLAGGPDCFGAFRDLVQLLLQITILHRTVGVRITKSDRWDRMVLEGAALSTDNDVVQLRDGRYLRLSVLLFREPHGDGHRLKVEQATYQYQADVDGNRWVFRYDYRREPKDQHPATHLQVRGQLAEPVPMHKNMLERVHFPTGRVSLEAVIRLLVEQFEVQTNEPAAFWRPILTQSEKDFLRIAHQATSGPAD